MTNEEAKEILEDICFYKKHFTTKDVEEAKRMKLSNTFNALGAM